MVPGRRARGLTVPLEVVEYTDPACPWVWGSEPKFRRLRAELPDARWRRVRLVRAVHRRRQRTSAAPTTPRPSPRSPAAPRSRSPRPGAR
ncbi:hypothetical protein DMA12_36115 [Amycolatopsis balhimycina DSM 5908]|uniref:Uncharacterized protein n=1 Tax=Amycolatopsis balhimycina DSM 5908 TaxID=1081091 RepID=A0A428W3N5_AMYBA|nr:hypothetical protein DMA12_36115 [Amycolatopsis balhimycina DSM 5908]